MWAVCFLDVVHSSWFQCPGLGQHISHISFDGRHLQHDCFRVLRSSLKGCHSYRCALIFPSSILGNFTFICCDVICWGSPLFVFSITWIAAVWPGELLSVTIQLLLQPCQALHDAVSVLLYLGTFFLQVILGNEGLNLVESVQLHLYECQACMQHSRFVVLLLFFFLMWQKFLAVTDIVHLPAKHRKIK